LVGDILAQFRDTLAEYDAWSADLATEDDLIIVRCLLQAVRAARRQG
jgi:hypothetical protein